MKKLSRRGLITAGFAAAAGAGGLGVASRSGLIPPDGGDAFGLGETLTYASHRLLVGDSPAQEFSRSQISEAPFFKGKPPKVEDYGRLQANGFKDWPLVVDGLVAQPGSFTLAELQGLPASSHITQLICEEGWSFIAEWIGTPLSKVLDVVGVLPEARYVVYRSMQERWFHSMDMADALHPQTLVTYGMNGAELPVGHGGPLRMRMPRQMGYKSVKFLTKLTLTDRLEADTADVTRGNYSWYAGI